MVATVNPSATAWFWLEDGQGWLYQYVNHFFNTKDVPQVVSISYGWSESDQCDIDPDECQSLGVNSQGYVFRVNVRYVSHPIPCPCPSTSVIYFLLVCWCGVVWRL